MTETIKEGVKILRLAPERQRKAALISRPDAASNDAFARFLAVSTVDRDVAQLPPYLRQPGVVAHFMSAPHDRACVVRFFDDLVIAMVGNADRQEARDATRRD